MRVIATAGHVDHGKSTLVRALTGTDPDRLAEEKRRGLTIDLGFAGMELPSGEQAAFVDVPGHRRFIGNMLAGLGPAPVVMLIVAADQGWQAQSQEHLDAVAALGISRGLVVITRCGLASGDQARHTAAVAQERVAATSLGEAPVLFTDAVTGIGLPELVTELDALVSRLPETDTRGPVRLWVDRSFTISGTGTVVTGTLSAGTLHLNDRLSAAGQTVSVRSLQVLGRPVDTVGPVSRVAVGLRGVSTSDVSRGTSLLTPEAFLASSVVDVRSTTGRAWAEASERVTVHVGTAAVAAHVRPLDDDHARLTLEEALPLRLGDRVIVRDDSAGRIHAGASVLDLDPQPFSRRGAARRRADVLERFARAKHSEPDADELIASRGMVSLNWLHRAGARGASGVREGLSATRSGRCGDWALSGERTRELSDGLRELVQNDARNELSNGVPVSVAASTLAVPDVIVAKIAGLTDLHLEAGRLLSCAHAQGLGTAEKAFEAIRQRLQRNPFDAPEADELAHLKLGPKELATAASRGVIVRIPAQPADIVLLPDGPARAMRELARLPQPFTTSQARAALGTTRRVAIPLLEHLDARGWTRREGNVRSVVR